MKRPPRKNVQEKQRHIARLQSLASLKRYLGPWEISPIEAEINSQLGLSDETFLRYERQRTLTERVEEVVGRIRPEDFADLTTRIYGAPKTLEAVLADPANFIDTAQETLTEEYRVAREESLAGLQKKDLKSLEYHFSLLGPDLLREPEVLSVFQHAWRGGLSGHGESVQLLTAIFNTFRPGKRPRTLYVDEARERNRKASSISKAVSRLEKNYNKWLEIFGDPEKATRQTKKEFKENSRIKDPTKKEKILKKFDTRLGK